MNAVSKGQSLNATKGKKMKTLSKEVSEKDILESLKSPIIKNLEDEGITLPYLAKRLKEELRAKTIKPFLGPGGEVIYSKNLDAWEIRQRARMDAHKLLDHYPSEKHKIEGSLRLENLSDEELDGRILKLLEKKEE